MVLRLSIYIIATISIISETISIKTQAPAGKESEGALETDGETESKNPPA